MLKTPSWTCQTMGFCECTCRPLPPCHQLQPTLQVHGSLCTGIQAPSELGHSGCRLQSTWSPCIWHCSLGTLPLRQRLWSKSCLWPARTWASFAGHAHIIQTRIASFLLPGEQRIAEMPRVCGELLNRSTGPCFGRLGVHEACSTMSIMQQPVLMLRSCPTS